MSCQFVNFKQPAVDKRSYHHHHATKWLTTMNKSFPGKSNLCFCLIKLLLCGCRRRQFVSSRRWWFCGGCRGDNRKSAFTQIADLWCSHSLAAGTRFQCPIKCKCNLDHIIIVFPYECLWACISLPRSVVGGCLRNVEDEQHRHHLWNTEIGWWWQCWCSFLVIECDPWFDRISTGRQVHITFLYHPDWRYGGELN